VSHLLQSADGSPDAALAAIAAAQRGAVAAWQLRQVGIGRGAVDHRVRRGTLHRRFQGVYLVGHSEALPGGPEVAALLACRRVATLCGATAAWLWGFGPMPEEVHVLTLAGRARSRPGLRVHQTRTLRRSELSRRCGLPLTSPLRTLLDLAAAGDPELERRFADAHARRLIDARALPAELTAREGLPGVRELRRLAGMASDGFTRSEIERRLRGLCQEAGLPAPQTNVRLCGWEVDFFWPQAGLVVEVDAFSTHGHASQFARDRRKQADLVAAGHPVLRFTGHQLYHAVPAVIARLTRALYRGQP